MDTWDGLPARLEDDAPHTLDLDAMLAGYLQCAVWASTDVPPDVGDREHAEPEPLDDMGYDVDDIAAESVARMRADVEALATDPDLADVWREYARQTSSAPAFGPDSFGRTRYAPSELAGHDFWLTRNGHGAGFWDRGLGDVGVTLSAACRPYGESNLYIGDDGKLYVD